ncbi:MAG TPA: deoxyribonuclease V [Patescibacteria group bacterium]|nr:deoxyribonuclease V [Patescibacteria group bacterium]
MTDPLPASWDISPQDAIELQKKLSGQITLHPLESPIRTIAGGDISFNLYSNTVYAGFIILKFPELIPIARCVITTEVTFPYVPGLLSFRESPALLKAWELIPEDKKPDIIMLDGQGVAHPRRFGIACHISLLTGVPALGCGKSLLTGQYTPPALEKGSTSDLLDKGEKIGTVLRTKNKVNPVFVSPGNRMTHEEAVEIALKSVTKYRIPEPTRLIHNEVNAFRRGEIEGGYFEL